MEKIVKMGILSLATFQAVLLGLVGLVCGIIYSFGGLIIDTLVSLGWVQRFAAETPGLSIGTLLAFGALIGMPVIAMGIGFLLGLLEALLFNLVARWFGGIRLGLEFTVRREL